MADFLNCNGACSISVLEFTNPRKMLFSHEMGRKAHGTPPEMVECVKEDLNMMRVSTDQPEELCYLWPKWHQFKSQSKEKSGFHCCNLKHYHDLQLSNKCYQIINNKQLSNKYCLQIQNHRNEELFVWHDCLGEGSL